MCYIKVAHVFLTCVASGSFDSPNVCSTNFTWDDVYAKVSDPGIIG